MRHEAVILAAFLIGYLVVAVAVFAVTVRWFYRDVPRVEAIHRPDFLMGIQSILWPISIPIMAFAALCSIGARLIAKIQSP